MKQRSKLELVSYRTLRRLVGWLGIALPVVLLVGCAIVEPAAGMRPSISDYYYSPLRDVLVGFLLAVEHAAVLRIQAKLRYVIVAHLDDIILAVFSDVNVGLDLTRPRTRVT